MLCCCLVVLRCPESHVKAFRPLIWAILLCLLFEVVCFFAAFDREGLVCPVTSSGFLRRFQRSSSKHSVLCCSKKASQVIGPGLSRVMRSAMRPVLV